MADAYAGTILSPGRKVIAARMTQAKQTIPHFRAGVELEVDALLELRDELRRRKSGAKVSLNDLLIKACASALMEVPAINIQFVEGEIRQYPSADISVVVAAKDSLSTPIVRGAEGKSIWEISAEIKGFAERAARNALKMDEIVGGTFSVSNLGMFGVDQFDAIINSPQCAILAIGAAKSRVLARNDEGVRIARVLHATLSVDHRTLDGAMAGAFLKALRRHVEHPELLRTADRDS